MDKASTENERNAVLATTASGREITFVQVAGLVARRILCYTKVGEKLTRGERYGFIRFGSRVDMYLPVDAHAQVAIGDKVTGVRTVLARLPLQAPEAATPTETPPAAAQAETSAPAQTVSEVAQSEIEAAADKVRNAAEQALKD